MKPRPAGWRGKSFVAIPPCHTAARRRRARPLEGVMFQAVISNAVHLKRINIRATTFVFFEYLTRAGVVKCLGKTEFGGKARGNLPIRPRLAGWGKTGLQQPNAPFGIGHR